MYAVSQLVNLIESRRRVLPISRLSNKTTRANEKEGLLARW
jgi:hypothetical protein